MRMSAYTELPAEKTAQLHWDPNKEGSQTIFSTIFKRILEICQLTKKRQIISHTFRMGRGCQTLFSNKNQ